MEEIDAKMSEEDKQKLEKKINKNIKKNYHNIKKNMYSVKDEYKKLSFGDIEIEKGKFQYYKHPTDINNINIDEIMIFNKVSFGKKVL